MQPITFDGLDQSGEVACPTINIWRRATDQLKMKKPIVDRVRHGDPGFLIERSGDQIKVRTARGRVGWITYWFVRELKQDWLRGVDRPQGDV